MITPVLQMGKLRPRTLSNPLGPLGEKVAKQRKAIKSGNLSLQCFPMIVFDSWETRCGQYLGFKASESLCGALADSLSPYSSLALGPLANLSPIFLDLDSSQGPLTIAVDT